MSFKNKVVLVTGAGSGFGKAVSESFAKLSATLSLIDVNKEQLDKCAEECKQLNEDKVLKHVLDIRNDEAVQKAVDDTVEKFGRIDVLVNCAGIYIPSHGSILDPKVMDTFDSTIAVNLRGLIRVTNAAAPALVTSKGCIVNIASIAAVLNTSSGFPYNISKSGVVHFTKCVALELAPHGVRANAILPGAASTNILLSSGISPEDDKKNWEAIASKAPMKRIIEVKDVADMAVYLAGDSARNITGGEFLVDTGLAISNFDMGTM